MTAQTAASPPASGSTYTSGSLKANEPGTEYVILRCRTAIEGAETGQSWLWIGTRTARTNDAALKAFLDDAKAGDQIDGTYLSIPARTYKPIKITQQTVTTLKLEEAK